MVYLLLGFLIAQPDLQQASALRLRAERASIVDVTAVPPVVEFDIVNNTSGTVTAWKVGVTVRRSNGSTERVSASTDAYVAFAGLIPDSGSVGYPHSTIRGSVTIGAGSDIQEVTAVLLCAVFADGTWTGDSADVDALFAQRDANYQALTDIITDLRAARVSTSGRPALRDALDRLNRPSRSGAASALVEVMRRNLQAALQPSDKPGAPPEQLLAQWILKSEARLQATETHRRKGAEAVAK